MLPKKWEPTPLYYNFIYVNLKKLNAARNAPPPPNASCLELYIYLHNVLPFYKIYSAITQGSSTRLKLAATYSGN